MELFLPNNHSKWQIDFKPLSQDNASGLKKVFLSNYSQVADDVLKIEQVAETEVNSNNFKITALKNGRKKFFLLRRYPAGRDLNSIKSAHAAMKFLDDSGLLVPELIKTGSGKEIFIQGNYFFSLFKFLKSNHFCGKIEEIKSAARQFGKMDFLLDKYPHKEVLKKSTVIPKKALELREFSFEIWKNIFAEARKHFKETGDEFDNRLLSFEDFILKAIKKTPPGSYDSLPKQIIHFDLHPHNLLTDGKKLVSVLDFDSLRYFERMRGVAFALHRLVRQHVVHKNPENMKEVIIQAKNAFLNAYQRENKLSKKELNSAAYFMRHEALSRLSYAMKDYYFNGNDAWKGDLEKQTATIAESEYFEN